MLLLRLTPVRWVSVLERNTLVSLSGVDPVISPRTTIHSTRSGSVDPGIALCMTIHSFWGSGLFATVNTERVRVVNLVFCYDFE